VFADSVTATAAAVAAAAAAATARSCSGPTRKMSKFWKGWWSQREVGSRSLAGSQSAPDRPRAAALLVLVLQLQFVLLILDLEVPKSAQ